jgi:hypothetical protein
LARAPWPSYRASCHRDPRKDKRPDRAEPSFSAAHLSATAWRARPVEFLLGASCDRYIVYPISSVKALAVQLTDPET